ncbi:MAG: hypothetical protein WBB28_01185 [Crinalium sp.]
MTWSIDIKGFHAHKRSKDDIWFTAIAPVWTQYAKQYNLRPVNHVKLQGVTFLSYDYWNLSGRDWHPENPFYQEKWIEIHPAICKWRINEHGEYVIDSRQKIDDRWRYFVPAEQLLPLLEANITYRSNDRENNPKGFLVCGKECGLILPIQRQFVPTSLPTSYPRLAQSFVNRFTSKTANFGEWFSDWVGTYRAELSKVGNFTKSVKEYWETKPENVLVAENDSQGNFVIYNQEKWQELITPSPEEA